MMSLPHFPQGDSAGRRLRADPDASSCILVQKLSWDWPCRCVCSILSLWGGSQRGPVLPAGMGGWGTWSWYIWFIWLCFRQIRLSSLSKTPKCSVSAAVILRSLSSGNFHARSLLSIPTETSWQPWEVSAPWTVEFSHSLLLEQNAGFSRVWSSLPHI